MTALKSLGREPRPLPNNLSNNIHLAKRREVVTEKALERNIRTKRKSGAGYGSLKEKPIRYTSKLRRKLADGVVCLESRGVENVILMTTTLAGATEQAIVMFEAYSSYFRDCFKSWVESQFPADQPVYYVWCYERQMRGALHMHFAVHVSNGLRGNFSHELIQAAVRKIHLEICEKAETDLFECTGGGSFRDNPTKPKVDVLWVEYTLVGYLSKKKSKTILVLGDGTRLSPTVWGDLSPDLKRIVDKESFNSEIPVPNLEEAYQMIDYLKMCADSVLTVNGVHGVEYRQVENLRTSEIKGVMCSLPVGQVTTVQKTLRRTSNALIIEARKRFHEGRTNHASRFSTDDICEVYKLGVLIISHAGGHLQIKFSRRLVADAKYRRKKGQKEKARRGKNN